MRALAIGVAATLGLLGTGSQAWAQSVDESRSNDYHYNECFAGDIDQPQLVYQISKSACIVNRTWGFSRNRRVIWVADGCSGRFANVGGYHHGRGDRYDDDARLYDHDGNDVGAVIGGVVLGAIIAAALGDDDDDKKHRSATPPAPGRTEFHRYDDYDRDSRRGDGPPQPGRT